MGIIGWVTTSESMSNLVHLGISVLVAFVVTFVLTYMFGYTKEMDEE